MSMYANYDTVDGIHRHLKRGLAGLNDLAKVRREAYYGRRERLNDFLVNGVWNFDSCGNLGRINEVASKDYTKRHANIRAFMADVGLELPDVISFSDFWELVKDHKVSVSTRHGHFLPSAKVVCVECKRGWLAENAHECVVVSDATTESGEQYVGRTLADVRASYDARTDGDWLMSYEAMVRNDEWIDMNPVPGYDTLVQNERGWAGAHGNAHAARHGVTVDPDVYVVKKGDDLSWHVWFYRHPECNRKWRAEGMVSKVTEAFSAAGYTTVQVTPIDNRYCPCEACSPWCAVETEVGLIVVGQRKRVLNVDWSSTGEDLLELFKGEEVTKDASYIHAWGWEKATDYLRRIRTALSRQKV